MKRHTTMNRHVLDVFLLGCLAALLAIGIGLGVQGCGSSDTAAPPPPDTSPPAVAQVTATRYQQVEVVFSEKVDPTSAEDESAYTLFRAASPTAGSGVKTKSWRKRPEGAADETLTIISAVLAGDGRRVTLRTDPMQEGAAYELTIVGVKDLLGNEIVQAVTAPVVAAIQSGKIFTIAGTGAAERGEDNMDPLKSALYLPQDMTVGPDGLLYVVDWNNHRIRVIEAGIIRTIIGGQFGDATPGPGVDVGLNHPTHVSFDGQGHLFMSAWHNSKIMIYDLATGYCDVYVGADGDRCFEGDGGDRVSAAVNLPSSAMIGPDGNLYISDQANFCVRMVDTQTGIISTVVGNTQCDSAGCSPFRPCAYGYGGDGGPAEDAKMSAPFGQAADPTSRLEFDGAGNLYLADTGNNRIRVVTNGIINTFAGTGVKGFSGDGGDPTAADLDYPTDIAVGLEGEIYIADTNNSVIRMVKDGVITTVVGQGRVAGFAGDGGDPKQAVLNHPYGVHVDTEGNLYIADTKNHRIRVVYK